MNPNSSEVYPPSTQAIINDYLAVVSPFQKSLILPLRQAILEAHPEMKEGLRWSSLTFSLNSQPIAVLHVAVDFVSVVFPEGSKLADPAGLLNGEDGASRSLPFSDVEDLDLSALKGFLSQLIK